MKNKLFSSLLCISLLIGCGGYDEISPNAYEYSKALYSICNRNDEAKLSELVDKIAAAEENQELTSKEAAWLNDIASTAQDGEWTAATKEARRLMEDQIHRP